MRLRAAGLLLVPAIAASGCALGPFVRTDGPAQTAGVSVALVEQSCDRRIDPNWSYADILALGLQVRVTNAGASRLLFDPAATRLMAGGQARAPHRADPPAAIAAGESQTFAVHFLERDDDLACNVPLAFALGPAVTVGGSGLALRPISFLASNGDI